MLAWMPKPVKVAVLLVVVAGILGLIGYEVWYFAYGRQLRRDRTRLDAEHARALQALSPLTDSGKQTIGKWEVQARHVENLEFADVRLDQRETGTIRQTITAPSMTVLIATSADPTAVVLADVLVRLETAFITSYDEEGQETISTQNEMELWLIQTQRFDVPGLQD